MLLTAKAAFLLSVLTTTLPAQNSQVKAYFDAFWKSAEAKVPASQHTDTARFREYRLPGIEKPGNVHHLVGQIFVAGASLSKIAARVRDYKTHAELFAPTIHAAALCRKEGDDVFIFRYWATTYRDTISETRATHRQVDDKHYIVSSVTTAFGTPGDLPDRNDLCKGALPGVFYMKQLHAVWRYEQTATGVQIQAETVAELSGWALVRSTARRILAQILTQSLESYRTKFGSGG